MYGTTDILGTARYYGSRAPGDALSWLFKKYAYYSDTHPSTEAQYKDQQFVAGFLPWYGDWMRGRAQDEWIDSQRKALGVRWSDIVNPWVAGLSGGNTSRFYGSTANMVSKNIHRLYK